MQLEYVDAYQTACGVKLDDGREVILTSLSQSMTYEGLLEGYPTSRENDRSIAYLVEAERKRDRWSPVVIEPTRRATFGGDRGPYGEAVNGRVPEWLPMVTCVARFTSAPTGRDEMAHISRLTVIWFQDGFALPIAEQALLALKALDWGSLAQDVEL